MSFKDDAPQTVGEALRNGWQWLGVQCDHCKEASYRVALKARKLEEPLALVARRCWCRRCGREVGRQYLRFHLGAEWRSVRTKPIAFSGLTAHRIGMN